MTTGSEGTQTGPAKGASADKADTPGKGNGKDTATAASTKVSKRKHRTNVEGLANVGKVLRQEYAELLDEHLETIQEALAKGAKSCSITFSVYWRTRKDLDIDMPTLGKVSLPRVGKTYKLRPEGKQGTLNLV